MAIWRPSRQQGSLPIIRQLLHIPHALLNLQAKRGRFRRWLVSMGLARARGPTNNKIRTSKYTALTFLPANLLQQFMRTANLYFLAVVLMQTIPGLSPTPWQATALPLLFVLTVNAIKVGCHEPRLARACLLHMSPVTRSAREAPTDGNTDYCSTADEFGHALSSPPI